MVEVVGNLQNLGVVEYADKSVKFELVDKFGKSLILENNFEAQQNGTLECTSDSSGIFSISLYPNTLTTRESKYKMTIDNNKEFYIFITHGLIKVNILCLLSKIDYDGVLTIEDKIDGLNYIFDGDFISLLEKYLNGEHNYMTASQKKFIDKFMSIANLPEDERCLDVKKLDEILGNRSF